MVVAGLAVKILSSISNVCHGCREECGSTNASLGFAVLILDFIYNVHLAF